MRKLLITLLIVAIGAYFAVVIYHNRTPSPTALYIGDSMMQRWAEADLLPPNVVAAGVGGETSSDVLYRWRSQYRAQAWQSMAIWMGTNDIAAQVSDERYQDNVRELVWSAKQAHVPHITIFSILPPTKATETTIPLERVQSLNSWLASFAAQAHVEYVDLASLSDADHYLISAYSSDGIHLNRDGYAVMARLVRAG